LPTTSALSIPAARDRHVRVGRLFFCVRSPAVVIVGKDDDLSSFEVAGRLDRQAIASATERARQYIRPVKSVINGTGDPH
jgi:hypothetical protein